MKLKQIGTFLSLAGLTILSFFSSSGQSPDSVGSLKSEGISFGISGTLEGYYSFGKGIRRGSAFAATVDANMSMDMQKLLGIPGGMFYTDLEYHTGDNPTNTLIGDFQVFDKHNAAPFFQVLEIWYQQKLFNEKLRVKIGKVDANTEFSVIDNGLEFINSSTQVTPTLFVFPTFPDPMPSINLFFTPGKLVYTNFAIYDANQSDHFLNFYGKPESVQPTLHGEFLLSESGLTWDDLPMLKKDGNFRLGLWKHTGTFAGFDGKTKHGAQGFYIIFNQTLWVPVSEKGSNRGVRIFMEYARSEPSLTPIYQHSGGGVTWTGPSASHSNDATGISVQYGKISPGLMLPHRYELNLETFYKFNITSWSAIITDFQYIIHPGGQYSNALVGTLLLNIDLGS